MIPGSRMVLRVLCAFSFAVLLAPLRLQATADSAILYVTADAGTAGDCSTWQKACALQTALGIAAAGDEIWVTVGIHLPDEGADQTDNDPASTYRLKDGVALYGGFNGTETVRTERSWHANVTVLSGDIDRNDVVDANGIVTDTQGIQGINAQSVLVANDVSASTVLDGFTVTAGQGGLGAGLACDNGSPSITHVQFIGNVGGGMGNQNNCGPALIDVVFRYNWSYGYGGMLNIDSNPTLINVVFEGNNGGQGGGGGMANLDSSPTLINVIFSDNWAWEGGGMGNYESDPVLINVTFAGNYGTMGGGGMFNRGSHPTIHNSIFWANEDMNGTGTTSATIQNNDSTPEIAYSLVQGSGGSGPGWDAAFGTDSGHNVDSDPRFLRNPSFGDGSPWSTWDNDLGNLRLQEDSPAIDAGNTAFLRADTHDIDLDGDKAEPCPLDLDNRLRVAYDSVDMGAYEFPLKSVFLPVTVR